MSPDSISSSNVLLESFTQEDFETARANLLERYELWNGILISSDQQSIITPDDLNAFRLQASEISEQEIKSDYEIEQLKILTVLTYLLMNADQALSDDDNKPASLVDNIEYPFTNHYIVKLILSQANKLNLDDITRLLDLQNQSVTQQYQESMPDEMSDETIATSITTQDGRNLTLKSSSCLLSIEEDEGSATRLEDEDQTQPTSPVVIERPAEKLTPIEIERATVVLLGDDGDTLSTNLHLAELQCGPSIGAATYIGIGREENEDGILLCPEYDQLTVIDAMGGYGNGVKARNIFVDTMIQSPGDIDGNVPKAQARYDEMGLEHGGVCLIHFEAIKDEDAYNIALSQAGDVHAILMDEDAKIHYESKDEAIGHRVFNAIISQTATRFQRANGWEKFGKLTKSKVSAKPGWRMAIYSDGIANHFPSSNLKVLLKGSSIKDAITNISSSVDSAMRREDAYQDNCSIVIIDF